MFMSETNFLDIVFSFRCKTIITIGNGVNGRLFDGCREQDKVTSFVLPSFITTHLPCKLCLEGTRILPSLNTLPLHPIYQFSSNLKGSIVLSHYNTIPTQFLM